MARRRVVDFSQRTSENWQEASADGRSPPAEAPLFIVARIQRQPVVTRHSKPKPNPRRRLPALAVTSGALLLRSCCCCRFILSATVIGNATTLRRRGPPPPPPPPPPVGRLPPRRLRCQRLPPLPPPATAAAATTAVATAAAAATVRRRRHRQPCATTAAAAAATTGRRRRRCQPCCYSTVAGLPPPVFPMPRQSCRSRCCRHRATADAIAAPACRRVLHLRHDQAAQGAIVSRPSSTAFPPASPEAGIRLAKEALPVIFRVAIGGRVRRYLHISKTTWRFNRSVT